MGEHTIKISVRNLVEFIMRSGSIDSSSVAVADKEAMQKGSKLHRKIQRRMGTNYTAEYPLSLDVPITYDNNTFQLLVEGRADGVIVDDKITIDEIKGIYMDLAKLQEPISVHLAQAKCYAYMYATLKQEECIGVRMTYCNIETEITKLFSYEYTHSELEVWFHQLIQEYAKWANWQITWRDTRNASLQKVEFPFTYRKGQKKLVTGVYQTILREKRLYIEAPTGVGKTISTVFPSVKAMGEGLVEKLFYLTAKTITRTVAEQTFTIVKEKGANLKTVTITAKDKICFLEEIACTPERCPYAEGHYDRVNDAVYDLITNEFAISRDKITEYAKKHRVCPFEMSLDVALWVDAIVCDYNYIFDPRVYLRRFFGNEKKENYVFLIDEAHNLVDRAREMYSASLIKEELLAVKRIVQTKSKGLANCLERCNREMLKWKRECETYEVLPDVDSFMVHLLRLGSECYEFLREHQAFEHREEVLNLYFSINHFLNMYEISDSKYLIYTQHLKENRFQVTLQCMDPSTNINRCLERGRSAIFFSATLLPIQYYKEQLAGREEDYAIYAESVFQNENREVIVASDVSTKYTRRTKKEYEKVVSYMKQLVSVKKGNYMIFFPSYQYMECIYQMILEQEGHDVIASIVCQKSQMNEEEKEAFLDSFQEKPKDTKIGFCVMGGIFSEGIDLKQDRLIGCMIVGTGLPMVSTERELYRQYYEEKKGAGFSYSYLYNGMNKVLQSGGRVIRTEEDKGIILLLDERFLQESYLELFPREWFPYTVVNRNNVTNVIQEFWRKGENK